MKIFIIKKKIKEIFHKIFKGILTYKPICCEKCGVLFDNKFEKHGFITSNIKIPDVAGFKTILRLKKQRYLCKHCGKTFTLRDNVTKYGCFIYKNTKWKIANELRNKISEKDIAKIIMFLLILLKELWILITVHKNFIKIIYPKFYLLMNLNQLNQQMLL